MRYLCFDTALNEDYTLLQLRSHFPIQQCLFERTKDAALWDVAPWLFQVQGPVFSLFASDELISLKRTVIFESPLPLPELCSFLQDYIYHTEAGKEYFFRFWDGAVLAAYLESCSPSQITLFFDKALSGIICDAGKNEEELIHFFLSENGRLIKKVIKKKVLDGQETDAVAAEAMPANTPETAEKKPRRFFLD